MHSKKFHPAKKDNWKMSEDKTYDKIHRAAQAKDLLSNEMLAETLDAVEKAFMDNWRATEPRDAAGRELLWNGYQGVVLFRHMLQSIISSGKMARIALDEAIANQERREQL
jgi:hypothetical protein